MAENYDVIVVGAGPAGLVAAKAAAESGFKVALLERKKDLTVVDRACGATLDSANEYLHHELYACNPRDQRLSFPAHGFSVKYDGPWTDLYAMDVCSPCGNAIKMGVAAEQRKKGTHGKITSILDKEILLKNLLEEATDYGVETFPGVNVDKVSATDDGVTVQGSGRSFQGRYLIAADGINSTVAKLLGFNDDRTYFCQFRALTYYVSDIELPDPDTAYNMTQFIKGIPVLGFAHRSASQGGYVFIVATLHPEINLKEAAEFFFTEAFCAPWFKQAKILRAFSANASCYSHIDEPCRGRVMVTGDVASTQELEITGAIIAGWKAGHAVALALHEENFGLEVTGTKKYAEWWQQDYTEVYSSDAYMKVWALPYLLTEPEEIDYLFGLIKRPLPASYNPYNMAKNMGVALREVLPAAEKERPELLQKMGQMRRPFTEIIADVTQISKPV